LENINISTNKHNTAMATTHNNSYPLYGAINAATAVNLVDGKKLRMMHKNVAPCAFGVTYSFESGRMAL